jgi:hypothetical protein
LIFGRRQRGGPVTFNVRRQTTVANVPPSHPDDSEWQDVEAYVIADLPDDVSIVALELVVNATGRVSSSTVKLVTPEDVDKAAKRGSHLPRARRLSMEFQGGTTS